MKTKVLLTLLIPLSLAVAFFASKINTGAWELTRWDVHVLSNMTALYFGTLMLTGAAGGLIASRQKTKRRKIIINVSTLAVVFLLANVLGRFMPFIGYIG